MNRTSSVFFKKISPAVTDWETKKLGNLPLCDKNMCSMLQLTSDTSSAANSYFQQKTGLYL